MTNKHPQNHESEIVHFSEKVDQDTQKMIVRFQFIYSSLGLLLGLTCMIFGSILFLRGVTGSTDFSSKILGAENKITEAAPGGLLFLTGLSIVYVTRFSVKTK